MIGVHLREIEGRWYGLARVGERIVATSAASSRQKALENLLRSLPAGATHQIVEESSEFVEKTVAVLAQLESGNEENKRFSLAEEYVPEPLAKVLKAAAAIPIGYVASYGAIAKASGTEARVVGRIMASNPLYPIVPCHRVVGADLSLVGYTGRKDEAALRAKLARLSREVRGFTEERVLPVNGRELRVCPVDWVITKAEKRGLGPVGQRTLF